MRNKFILESMASDLKRVALGLHRGSTKMANRFLTESLKRKEELNMDEVAPYLKKFISKLDWGIGAEEALMYSTLIQNYSQNYKDDLGLNRRAQQMKLGKYKHSKTGNFYRVLGVAKNSETLDEFVVYEALYENPTSKLWIRPIKMFLEEVEIKGKKVLRFQFIGK